MQQAVSVMLEDELQMPSRVQICTGPVFLLLSSASRGISPTQCSHASLLAPRRSVVWVRDRLAVGRQESHWTPLRELLFNATSLGSRSGSGTGWRGPPKAMPQLVLSQNCDAMVGNLRASGS